MSRRLLERGVKFYLVGGVGILVQLIAFTLLKAGWGVHYLLATVLSVEAAVLHNFVWHQHWTWADRPAGQRWRVVLGRLFRFNLSNGALSILSNVVLMRVLVGTLHIHYLLSMLISITITSVLNFLVSDRYVFRQGDSGAE